VPSSHALAEERRGEGEETEKKKKEGKGGRVDHATRSVLKLILRERRGKKKGKGEETRGKKP